MNERIKNLLMEARLFCYDDGTVSLLGETYVGQAEIQKFAELIVRECADQCTTDGSFCAEVVWGKQFNKKILKHFGVEE